MIGQLGNGWLSEFHHIRQYWPSKERACLQSARLAVRKCLHKRLHDSAPAHFLEMAQAGTIPLVPTSSHQNSKAEAKVDQWDFIYDPKTVQYGRPTGERAISRFATQTTG